MKLPARTKNGIAMMEDASSAVNRRCGMTASGTSSVSSAASVAAPSVTEIGTPTRSIIIMDAKSTYPVILPPPFSPVYHRPCR